MKALLALAVALALGTPPAAERCEFVAPHMGTTARLVVYGAHAEAEAAAQAAFARLGELDRRLSDYRDDSDVSLLMEHGGHPLAVSPDLLTVLITAQDVAKRSEGAFDVTVGPLSRLWRRARRTGDLPSPEELRSALALVGHDGLSFDVGSGTARLHRTGMRLDLGGIAKGYAADEALRVFRARGLDRALVTLGGEVVAGSPPPGRDGWTVAVRTPGAEQAPLSLHDAAASTSGDAEQWMEVAGQRYSHVFDPRTGQALVGRRSVSVVAGQGIVADALATALSVLGPSRGQALVDTFPGAAALWVETGAVTESSGWSALPRAPAAAIATH